MSKSLCEFNSAIGWAEGAMTMFKLVTPEEWLWQPVWELLLALLAALGV